MKHFSFRKFIRDHERTLIILGAPLAACSLLLKEVVSHRDAPPSPTDNNVCLRAVEPQPCDRFVMNLPLVDM